MFLKKIFCVIFRNVLNIYFREKHVLVMINVFKKITFILFYVGNSVVSPQKPQSHSKLEFVFLKVKSQIKQIPCLLRRTIIALSFYTVTNIVFCN